MTTRKKRPSVPPQASEPAAEPAVDLPEYVRLDGSDISTVLASLDVEKARAGDTDAAFDILRYFVSAVDQHNEHTWHGAVHWHYARYIADAFEKIVRAAMRVPARLSGPRRTAIRSPPPRCAYRPADQPLPRPHERAVALRRLIRNLASAAQRGI